MSNHSLIPSPPPELMEEWRMDYIGRGHAFIDVATKAVQWGADQELEACCGWLQDPDLNVDTCKLRATRRPKSPSLAKRALDILGAHGDLSCAEHDTIRRTLEALND